MNDAQALISVVVPVYNTEKTLRECVESILRQEYRNLEIILVDDGSSDRSPEICEEYREKDSRIKVIRQENLGPAGARNTGLDAATGDFIGFADSDDRIGEGMYQSLYDACVKYQADFAWCGIVFIKDGQERRNPRFAKEELLDGKKMILKAMLESGVNTLSVGDKLFRAERIRNVRFPELKVNEDVLALYRIVDGCGRAVRTGRYDYYYCFHETGQSQQGYSKEKAEAFLCNLNTVRKMIVPDYPELLPLYRKNEAELSFALLHQYLQSGGRADTDEYRSLKKQFDRNFGTVLRMKQYRAHALLLRFGMYGPLRRLLYKFSGFGRG